MRQRRSDGSGTPPAEPLPAEPIGPYQLLGVLGSGTMGAVYRARHQDSGRVVALKTIHAADEGLLPAMRREVLALAQLHHPGIVTVVGVGTERGWPWYAMELIEGPTLRDYRQALWSAREAASGEVPADGALRAVLSVARKLCITLAYLHGEGLVHRDLKPLNVILRDGVSPVLVDFGVSAWLGSASGREALEQHHANAGTLAYMSPEALRGEALDARADLYSFGCILYELLCGAPPFTRKRLGEVITGHLKRRPVPPSQHVPELPAALDELVAGLLAKSPQERIGYAADVAAALAELGAEEGDGAGVPPARPYLYRADCVGREAVIGEVLSQLDRGLSGAAAHVLLSGEEGAGKTRLTMEISRKLGRAGVLVLMGSCRPHGPLLEGFGGPLQQIAERCRSKGQEQTERWLGPHARLLARYQPALRPLCEGDAATTSDKPSAGVRQQLLAAGGGRHPLPDALCATLAAIARDTPLVVMLDDLQWADELSWHTLQTIIASPELAQLPVAMLGACRSGAEGRARLAELSGYEPVCHLPVEGLDKEAIGQLVQQMLGMRDRPQALVEELAEQTQGNPFFIAEYLHEAVAEGLLERDKRGRWRLVRSSYDALPVPESIRVVVERRTLNEEELGAFNEDELGRNDRRTLSEDELSRAFSGDENDRAR